METRSKKGAFRRLAIVMAVLMLLSSMLTAPIAVNAAEGDANLVVTNITWSPENPQPGDEVTFSATVKNIGTDASRNAIVGVRFDIGQLGSYVSWSDNTTASIPAGGELTVTANGGPSGKATWTAGAKGTTQVIAWVDDQNRIPESNTGDNQLTSSMEIGAVVEPEGPCDLTISTVRAETGTLYMKDNTKLVAFVKNSGEFACKDAFQVDFYMDSRLVDSVTYSDGIAAGSTAVITSQQGWSCYFGTHTLRAIVNSTRSADETNTENNRRSALVKVKDAYRPELPTEPETNPPTDPPVKPTDPPVKPTDPTQPTTTPGGITIADKKTNVYIKDVNSDTYLYIKNGAVAAGPLNTEEDFDFCWNFIAKDDGTYWIQSASSGQYMCLENRSGKIDMFGTIYEVWMSSKWMLSGTNASLTIENVWLNNTGDGGFISASSGSNAVYGTNQQKWMLVKPAPKPGQEDDGIKGELYDTIASDKFVIPEANSNMNSIGASMPYTRYDTGAASIGGGAALATSADFGRMNIASQASEQSYVRLPSSGSYAEWTMKTTGAGVTMRFTMPDSGDGRGLNGSLDVYVNGSKVKTVDLTSYYMWQYFSSGHPSDSNDGGAPCFAFDEVHFLLDTPLKSGDKIRIQSSGAGGLEYGIDFLEVEDVPDPIQKTAGAFSVVDFGAKPNDGKDDLGAIKRCMAAADAAGKDVYFPEGTYHIDQMWLVNASNMKIYGAGIWYTNIQFTNDKDFGGGISGGHPNGGGDGYCDNVEFCHMYINSNLRSRYNQMAVYKCFMDIWSEGSVIHDIWEDHFECGFWFGDYNGKMDYCDGVKVVNSRIRNNLADGVNFCQGTSNAVVYNCDIRNNGDDGLAMWNNSDMGAKDEVNNTLCYNTIELIWRAGAIAIYGGSGHKIYNNYMRDVFMSAGIHLNTTFPGHKFGNNTGITFDNNILVRCGTVADCWNEDFGAIDLKGDVRNITFNNTYLYNSQHHAIRIMDNPTGIVFNNTKVYGAGVGGQTSNYSSIPIKGCLIRLSGDGSTISVKFNGLDYANIAYSSGAHNPAIYGNTSSNITNMNNLGNNYTFTIPSGTTK